MKIKTSELIDAALDWAVAIAEYNDGRKVVPLFGHSVGVETAPDSGLQFRFYPSTNGSQGITIIEREGIHWINNGRRDKDGKPYKWLATKDFSDPLHNFYGPTILVACLRCFVASRLGDEVDVPEELCHEG